MACIVLAVGLAAVPIPNAASRTPRPAEAIVTVQMGLRMLGYDPGLIDGLRGPRTLAALRAYAKDRSIVLNHATVELVLTLLHAEASEQLLHSRETGEPECPGPEGEVSILPLEQW
jgi:hypothetical protein